MGRTKQFRLANAGERNRKAALTGQSNGWPGTFPAHGPPTGHRPPRRWTKPRSQVGFALAWAVVLGLLAASPKAWPGVRFDVFWGYDGLLPEANWFPVVCEVHNDGPTFQAVVEVGPGQLRRANRTLWAVELPTGTTKRFTIPVFSPGRWTGWEARLRTDRGSVVTEASAVRVRQVVDPRLPLVAALTRAMPILPPTRATQSGLMPMVARLQPPVCPDHPLAWQGLDTLYLSSEMALELKVPQVNALLAWLRAGGRLVVGIEQPSHVMGNEWLRALLPCDITGLTMVSDHADLQRWLTSPLPTEGRISQRLAAPRPGQSPMLLGRPLNPYATLQPDKLFESAPMQVASVRLRDGQVLVGPPQQPLMVSCRRGRGELIVLLFSPELEPFRSWGNRPWFWARLAEYPAELFQAAEKLDYAGYWSRWSTDGVFGSLIETRQVRKLPVGWLALLLLGYLMVIGPVDRWWLKKLRRQVWTWVTFPVYVVLFSVLIYLIGYKLRAGETEFNELHVVDVIPTGPDQAECRGTTYATIYSPVNATYRLAAELPAAGLRAEHMSGYGGVSEAGLVRAHQLTAGCSGEVFVRVWTSEMVVGEWWARAEAPLAARITPLAEGWEVWVANHTRQPIRRLKLVLGRLVVELGQVPAGQQRTFQVAPGQGQSVVDFVNSKSRSFINAIHTRRRAFSAGPAEGPLDPAEAAVGLSLIGFSQPEDRYSGFVAPGAQDLSELVHRGDALLLAWVPNYAPVRPLNRFPAPRTRRDSLLRLALPMSAPSAGPAR